MLKNPSLITRIAIGKLIGLIFGILAFSILSFFVPDTSWLLRFGILLWYTTVGSIIGVFGVINYHPIFHIPFHWWCRAPLIGAWMNFTLTFFAYDEIKFVITSILGENGFISSPFWSVLWGALIGLVIGFLATYCGGEGKETVS